MKLKKIKVSEKEIQKTILDWLKWHKQIFCWRNNSGAMVSEYKGKKRFMRFGAEGSPDIFAVKMVFPCPGNGIIGVGQIIGIEVKSPTGKMSEAQEKFREEFQKVGGIYILARSVEDVEQFFD